MKKLSYNPPTIEDLGNYTELTQSDNLDSRSDNTCPPPYSGTIGSDINPQTLSGICP